MLYSPAQVLATVTGREFGWTFRRLPHVAQVLIGKIMSKYYYTYLSTIGRVTSANLTIVWGFLLACSRIILMTGR
jgi:hypothetical protein